MPDRADAEDVVSETFAVTWRRLGHVPQGEAARLWLFGTGSRPLSSLGDTDREVLRLQGLNPSGS